MRKRLSYANVTATLALVFAMSGGALAANHYLINSTKQINPKVLKKLVGKTGKTGPAGAAGATGSGATGPQGSTGKEGPKGEKGESGKEGPKGENGSALAYAHVLASGALDTSHSKNVSTASTVGLGLYCLKVTVAVTNASGVVDTGEAEATGEVAAVLSGQDPKKFIEALCPAGDNVIVRVDNHEGLNENSAFWVNFN